MTRLLTIALAATTAALAAAPAFAQDSEPRTGIYAVVRGGLVDDSNLKFKGNNPATSRLQSETDLKRGFTGEIGAGLNFGNFRLETTFGYGKTSLDVGKAQAGGFTASGRARQLTFDTSGYVELPIGSVVRPFLGGGIGLARVNGELSRVTGTPAVGSRFDDKDWGFRWHTDVGIGFQVTPSTVLEVSGRYEQTSGLKFSGTTAGTAATFRPKLQSRSVLFGLRQAF
ncbi:MAG: outer membrane beta-barrel protein [Alphaproteobacteria bacterium]|nr:outer membrane beta-barrel protein [Alphaproteobacteria bacterium]